MKWHGGYEELHLCLSVVTVITDGRFALMSFHDRCSWIYFSLCLHAACIIAYFPLATA